MERLKTVGGASAPLAPSPPPPLPTPLITTVIHSDIFILYIYRFTVLFFNFSFKIRFYKIILINA